jgi:hypothetical protein
MEPLTPSHGDLRHFPDMPLDVVRLRASEFAATGDPQSNFYALMLWAAAWHQVPAGSLPSDDAQLGYLAGLGRDKRSWRKVREGALRGWILCSDGRLYHPVIAEKVHIALQQSKNAREKAARRWSVKSDQVTENKGGEVCSSIAREDAEACAGAMPGIDRIRSIEKEDPNGSSKKPSGQGTRLPAGALLDPDWRDWAIRETGQPRDWVDRQWAQFLDYWVAQPAAKGRKSDWPATWRNWIRRAEDYGKSTGSKQKPSRNVREYDHDSDLAGVLRGVGLSTGSLDASGPGDGASGADWRGD